MSSTNFHWAYALAGYLSFMLAFLFLTLGLSITEGMFDKTPINIGAIFNILQFIIGGVLCLGFMRLLSKSKITAREYGIHKDGLIKTIGLGAVLGLLFLGVSEIAESMNEELRKGGEQVAKSMNIGSHLINDILTLLNIGLFAPVAEELIFRGGVFNPILQGLKKYVSMPRWLAFVIATAVSSYLFASIHGGGGQDAQMVFLLLLGVLTCIGFYISKNIAAPILIHAVNNNLVFVLMVYTATGLATTHSWLLVILSLGCILLSVPLAFVFGRILKQEAE